MRKFRIHPNASGFELREVKIQKMPKIFGGYYESEYEVYVTSGSQGELEIIAKHLCTEPKEISCSQSQ